MRWGRDPKFTTAKRLIVGAALLPLFLASGCGGGMKEGMATDTKEFVPPPDIGEMTKDLKQASKKRRP